MKIRTGISDLCTDPNDRKSKDKDNDENKSKYSCKLLQQRNEATEQLGEIPHINQKPTNGKSDKLVKDFRTDTSPGLHKMLVIPRKEQSHELPNYINKYSENH